MYEEQNLNKIMELKIKCFVKLWLQSYIQLHVVTQLQ